jgi:iron complex transport system ATP-binding protein
LLRADDVTFGYGGPPILHGVSVDVDAGGFVGILGPNGSGKTTLLRLLAGAVRPSSGRVTLEGADLRQVPRSALARRMAVVPQETHLAFDYSVLEIALMGRYPHLGAFEIEGPRDLAIAGEALAATGTLELQHRPFSTLSGGEKQRVVIASALAQFGARNGRDTSQGVLLLDEPTASLDLGYQLEVADVLRRLRRERRVAMVLSTHDLNFAAALCERLVLLRRGRVLAAGPPETVLTAGQIGRLYDIEADVRLHPGTGHLTVVPLRRRQGAP